MNDVMMKFRYDGVRFWHEHRALAVLFFWSLLLDALSTVYFMHYFGPCSELHPLVRTASVQLGYIAGPFVGALCKTLAALVIVAYYQSLCRSVIAIVTGIYFFATAYNLFAHELYVRGIVSWLPF